MPKIYLNLAGLTFNTCERNVTNILRANDHVTNVYHVDLTSAEIEVDDDSNEALKDIIEDIVDIGYEASLA